MSREQYLQTYRDMIKRMWPRMRRGAVGREAVRWLVGRARRIRDGKVPVPPDAAGGES